jgi:SAM-dependent methyltransferase
MVRYQPTTSRAILEMLARAGLGPDDVFYDLGSGLGHVVLLVALLTGARAKGVEIEPAYCDYARQCARNLGIGGVDFIEGDVRDASLAGGTVYFLYTPFRGALLEQVLETLRAEAHQRPIRVCTYGPCTVEVARTTWLARQGVHDVSEHGIATFRSG